MNEVEIIVRTYAYNFKDKAKKNEIVGSATISVGTIDISNIIIAKGNTENSYKIELSDEQIEFIKKYVENWDKLIIPNSNNLRRIIKNAIIQDFEENSSYLAVLEGALDD